ncbi:hypothetical protein B0H65DRAFT_457880 [Neurospora tetraspora]|uniref:Uncharacterized protein n=1 Tax=Neurospora tetraspora TaxID=94610 RepID=A0AAE0JKQ4_9PEZI|nr:hypothetical protein B0H65DRAFT_457880 [Neurospora tetraspora]
MHARRLSRLARFLSPKTLRCLSSAMLSLLYRLVAAVPVSCTVCNRFFAVLWYDGRTCKVQRIHYTRYRSCGFSIIALAELRVGGYNEVDHLDIVVGIYLWASLSL